MKRKDARENAFILLFERLIKAEETNEEIFTKAVEERELEFDDYVKGVFFGYSENKKIVDELIDTCLVGWKRERVSFVSRAILTLATYEMMFLEDVPHKVAINEAVELSKKYDEDKAYVFVNGVLHAISLELAKK